MVIHQIIDLTTKLTKGTENYNADFNAFRVVVAQVCAGQRFSDSAISPAKAQRRQVGKQ